jgi:hypothetical protein
MRVLGFMAITYVGDFFKESLLSVKDHVDKIHICYSRNPSHGHGTELPNPDKEHAIRNIAMDILGDKLIWTSHEIFSGEAEHRNMRYTYATGYSLILTVDPDEIHDSSRLANRLNLIHNGTVGTARFWAIDGYVHFWKGFTWCFEHDGDKPIRIERLTSDNLDTLSIPLPIYHMSMSQNEDLIRYKFSCFGHKNEIKEGYFEKWLSWTPEDWLHVTHLHPTRDDIWFRPERFTGELPALLKNHIKPQKLDKMKILWIPLDYHRHEASPELFTDQLNALNTVAEARIYSDLGLTRDFSPDVILFQGSVGWVELMELKHATGALICMYTGDGTHLPPQSFVTYKAIVDMYLVPFSGRSLEPYQTLLGKPCHFLWEAIQNWRFVPNRQMDSGPITYVGNHYAHLPGDQPRLDLAAFVKDAVPELRIYGNGPRSLGTVDYTATPQLYNESFAVICENNYSDKEEYFTPRNLGAMAAGSCALHKWFPGIEKHFQNYTHGLVYKNKYELVEMLNYLKNNPSLRNHLADYGFKLANEKFTARHWAEAFIKIVKTNYL